jgi:hypothetical protein
MRRTPLPAATVAALLLLAACAEPEGPGQPERIAAVRQTWDATEALARDAETRIEQIVIPTHPELAFTANDINSENGAWRACNDELYDDHWDGPDESYWLYGISYDIASRVTSIPLVEPLVQSYLADGWTLWRDHRDEDSAPWVDLAKDGYTVRINSSAQAHLDAREDREAFISITVISPCAPSPDNITEWDREHPDDYSFVTQAPPEPTW